MNVTPQPGTRVTCIMGVDSGKTGTVLERSAIRTDGRGVPKIPGCYYPMKAEEVPVRFDDGTLFIHNRVHLADVRA
jgi:hypothetical protein